VSGRSTGQVMTDVRAAIAGVALPGGVITTEGGDAEQQSEIFLRIFQALGVAVLLMYLILAMQFGSFVDPLAIMLSLPLSLIGVMLALAVTGLTINIMSLIGVILQLVTVFLTAFSIVRERERGTMEQLLVTPVSKEGLILGKLLPYCAIGFMQTGLVLLVMVVLFGVPIHGSVSLLLLLSGIFLIPALGMGIVISTFASNQGEAMQMAVMVMLPSILLSGFVFPRESMPSVIYLLSFLIPATYYIEILRGIILRGAGWSALWDEALVLLAFGVLFMVLSAIRFKKRLG